MSEESKEVCPRCSREVTESAWIDGVEYGWCPDCGDYTS